MAICITMFITVNLNADTKYKKTIDDELEVEETKIETITNTTRYTLEELNASIEDLKRQKIDIQAHYDQEMVDIDQKIQAMQNHIDKAVILGVILTSEKETIK